MTFPFWLRRGWAPVSVSFNYGDPWGGSVVGVLTDADDCETLVDEDCVVADEAAGPVWAAMAQTL